MYKFAIDWEESNFDLVGTCNTTSVVALKKELDTIPVDTPNLKCKAYTKSVTLKKLTAGNKQEVMDYVAAKHPDWKIEESGKTGMVATIKYSDAF